MLISPWKGMEEDRSRRGESGDGPSGSGSAWRPRGGVFRAYTLSQSSGGTSQKSGNLRVVVRRPMVARLTKYLIDTYQSCNPSFQYSESLNPKRFLTNPSVGVLNDGFDNANSDLILYVNLVLVNSQSKQRYIVKDILGQGTFGQVAKCWVLETNSYVAVKVIKNQPAYYQQAVVEVNILNTLNRFDPDDKHHIVRILDFFVFQHHLCITFEMLGSNLFDLLKMNHFKGLSLSIVQMFSKQILHALVVMKDAGIIHCDLKPENILISTSVKPAGIKVIDFGSACKEGQTVYSYIQSRYYRSPEVLLGYPYTTAIDMWSFGCIVAELFLGLPLFPGASEYDLLKRMIDVLGAQPPDDLLRDAKNTSKFFKHVGSIYHLEDDGGCKRSMSLFRILTEEEYEARESKKPVIGKQYFPHVMLEDMVTKYPHRKNLLEEEISKENLTRLALLDFLRGLVEFDPGKRWSPWQASQHPFVTGEPFSHPYKPPPDAPRIPVIHTVTVDHNPIGGHWLAAGFSPQVVNMNQCIPRNGSRVQMTPFSYGSYGSMGSHGSYNDNVGLGSSYGSYGDVNSFYNHYTHVGPSGLSIQAQVGGSLLGASPDARRKPHLSHGSGFTISPSTANFAPMSLGASPSQFTPPSSQMHISASPGKFGPTSPARCGIHGSPLSKAVAVGQYNRRRNWGNHGTSHIQPQEIAFQQWQGHHVGIITSTHADAYSWGHTSPSTTLSTPSYYSWRQQTSAGNGVSSGPSSENYQNFLASHAPVHVAEMLFDKPDNSSLAPDPADWDPNYSDDLLLQEDNSELTSLSSGVASGMRLNHTTDTPTLTSRANQHLRGHNQAHATPNFSLSNQRTGARPQGYLFSDASPTSGHGRLPHFSHKSPSRFGQQPVHRSPSHMQAQTSSVQSEQGHHHRSQQARSIYSMADSHVPASSSLGNGISWVNLSHAGRDFGRAGHPIAATLQSSHASPEFGSIS